MKTLTNLFKNSGIALLLSLPIMFFSCSEEEGEPAPVADFSVIPANVVVGEYVTLQSQAENATAYEWSFGNGETSTEENPIVSFSAAGDYTVTLITTGPGGTDQNTKTITVNEPELLFMSSGDLAIYSIDIASNTATSEFTVDGYGFGLDFNPLTNTLFYTDEDNGTIETNNLTGSSEQSIISANAVEVFSVAVDTANSKIYYADRTTGSVWSAGLDGSSPTELFTGNDGLEVPTDIALDLENDKIYISDVGLESSGYAADGIWEGDLDGSSISQVIVGGGYSVSVDMINDNLYYNDAFIDQDLKVVPIGDWSNLTSVVNTLGYERIYGLKVFGSKLYWSDLGADVGLGSVHRANLDGSSPETLADMLSDPRHLVIYK